MSGRFHNQLLRARLSRTQGGFLLAFTPPNPSLDPRFMAAGLYELASEMERRSHDLGARWAITVEPWSGRILIETVEGEKADVDQFVANLIRDLELD